MRIGPSEIARLIYETSRAQFNAEVAPEDRNNTPFEEVTSDVREHHLAIVAAYYQNGHETGNVVTDAILATLR